MKIWLEDIDFASPSVVPDRGGSKALSRPRYPRECREAGGEQSEVLKGMELSRYIYIHAFSFLLGFTTADDQV